VRTAVDCCPGTPVPPWGSQRVIVRCVAAWSSAVGTLAGVTVSLHHIVIDARDLSAQARFWARVLNWKILSEREREIVIGADETAPVGICFMPVADSKMVKNRLHLDLTPGPDGRDAEVERILALGARRVDIGQSGTESWTVLADPEGNEFCILRPKKTLIA
jgi:predicted enzyme related to lactoylglutathione lyase